MHVKQVNITARHSANVVRGILASKAQVGDGLDSLVHANNDLIDRPRALLHRVEVDVPGVDGVRHLNEERKFSCMIRVYGVLSRDRCGSMTMI
jgi:hypothetical protein